MHTNLRGLALALGLAFAAACSRSPAPSVAPPSESPPSEPPAATVATRDGQTPPTNAPTPLPPAGQPVDDHAIGAPRTFENLTVFPITSDKQVDVGPITTLEAALKKHDAEVREIGADAAVRSSHHSSMGGGAQVNQLVIENKGTIPIYVLAGTVVKGGNQDRQIGQDFIIDAKQTTGVDAFCVEHGRWTGERNGHSTEGKFDTMTQLVTSSVRAAGQYKQNQGEVWAKVADVNTANRKNAVSGTLLATLDDAEVQKHRAALATQIVAYLKSVQPSGDVVGVAYAVDGRVRGARWFVNHTIYDLYRDTLVNTAAVDAITASASRDPSKPPPPVAALTPAAVVSFISDVESAAQKSSRDTSATVNEYRETAKAYGSKTMMKGKADPNAPPAAPKPAVKLSSDYLLK